METRNMALLFAIAAVLAISLMASGCTQQSAAPGSLPSQTGTGQQTAQGNNGNAAVAPNSNPAFVPEQPASDNASGQANAGNASGNGQSQGKIYDVAGNESGQGISNTLAACVAISDQPQRLSCIAQWCGSAARDFNQCYNLTDENDRLGCLNKCNPNPNT